MVLRACHLCDRKFAKTEHFKRHQRSHTKERPYECPTCNKRFSRSDVLFRHTKLHSPQDSAQTGNNAEATSSTAGTRRQSNRSIPSPYDYDANPQATLNGFPSASSQLANQGNIPPELSHMSLPKLASPYDPILSSISDPSPHPPTQHFNRSSMIEPSNFHANPHSNHVTMSNMDPALHEHSLDPSLMDDSIAHNVPQDPIGSPNQLQDFHGNPDDMLQFWLSQADNDMDFSIMPFPDLTPPSMDHHTPSIVNRGTPPARIRSDSGSIGSIPEARFARVEQVWRDRFTITHDLQSIWPDVAGSPCANILCCDESLSSSNPEIDVYETRWGVDGAVRNRLKSEFRTPAATPSTNRPLSTHNLRSNIPPPEVLDISLDLYFRRIHPTIPFIHIPTFQASSTPSSLLFTMCTLGLNTMGTSEGSKFLKKAFLGARSRALQELVTISTASSSIEQRLCSFATSLLNLQHAALSSDKDFMGQSQSLYSTLISTAQRQGIFATKEVDLNDLLPDSMDLKQRWQAWARVESVKRLISCMLSTDWWWGNTSCVSPIVRPESVHLSLPGDDDLFTAPNAEEWYRLIKSGRNAELPVVRPRTFHLRSCLDSVLLQPHPLQAFSMFSLLTVMKHLVSDVQHRFFAQIDDWTGPDRLLPWKAYESDFRARSLAPLVVAMTQGATSSRRHNDLNVMILWHNVNINLAANMQLFELAAGRSGPQKGTNALVEIAEWAKTPSARRACIHAAQTYKLLCNRKVSDTLMLNSMSALFGAALILALYLFQMPQDMSPGSVNIGGGLRFDLLGEIDWTSVSNSGLVDVPESSSNNIFEGPQRSAATDFINFGGPVSLNGMPAGGYLAARRVLLDHAHLMDEMGAWKPKTFSRILHIMSDVLEDGNHLDG